MIFGRALYYILTLMPNLSNTDTYWSELYDNGRDFTLISGGTLSKLLSYTNSSLPKTCLDIGCGSGQLTRELYHRGYQCIGLDASVVAVQIASQQTVIPHNQLRYEHFDIEFDDFAKIPRQPYSLIVCKLVYAFIHDKPALIEHVNRLLAPGGIFIVITPHVDDTLAGRSGIAVGDNELELLANGFKQLDLYKGEERSGALTYFVGSKVLV